GDRSLLGEALSCSHRGAMRVGEGQVRAVVADRADRDERDAGEGNARAAGASHTGVHEDEEIRHSGAAESIRRRRACGIGELTPDLSAFVPWGHMKSTLF